MGRGKRWNGDWGAIVGPHDALCKQKIAEQRCDEQILAEKPLKEGARQDVPSNSVRDCCEYPVEFPQRRFAISLPPRNTVDQLHRETFVAQKRALAEPSQCDLRHIMTRRRFSALLQIRVFGFNGATK